MCPKVESPEHLGVIAELLDTLEAERGLKEGHTRLVALVETADAYFRLREIAKATPRLDALSLGAEDFATALGMEPIGETLQAPKQTMIIAARAAGILPLGFMGTVADFDDLDAFRATIRRSRKFGFAGGELHSPEPGADPQRGVRLVGCGGRPRAAHGRSLRCRQGPGPRRRRLRGQDDRRAGRRARRGPDPPGGAAARAPPAGRERPRRMAQSRLVTHA